MGWATRVSLACARVRPIGKWWGSDGRSTHAQACNSETHGFGWAHGHFAVTIDRDNLTCGQLRLAEETEERPTSVGRGDDRMRVRASLDAITLAYSRIEKRGERALPEFVLWVRCSRHGSSEWRSPRCCTTTLVRPRGPSSSEPAPPRPDACLVQRRGAGVEPTGRGRRPSNADAGLDAGTLLAALAGPRPWRRPVAFRYKREQAHFARSLDRDRELTLMPAARSAHPPRPDLPSVGRVPAQLLDILVVDLSHLVLAEEARFPPEYVCLAAARTSWARSWLAVFPSFRLRCHASNLHPGLRPGPGSCDRAESRPQSRTAMQARWGKPRRATIADAGRERRPGQGHARGIRAILGVRVRLSRLPPVLELQFSPCRGFRVMPTNGAKLSDQEGCNEGLAETQEAWKEACAEDAQGTTDRKARRRQTCQPGARRLTGRPHPQADRKVGPRGLGARL